MEPVALQTEENKLDLDGQEYYGYMYGWGRLTVNIIMTTLYTIKYDTGNNKIVMLLYENRIVHQRTHANCNDWTC